VDRGGILSRPALSVTIFPRSHRGATLIELILYMGILGLVAILTIPLLFSSAENRMLQQTIALVELNGTQAVQTVTLRIRAAERIVHPAKGQTGSYLALQMGSEEESPVLIGVDDGRVTVIEHTLRESITSAQVAVQNFEVRNTSVSDDRPSVAITFRVSRTIRLQQPRSYHRDFATAISLSPVDVLAERMCASCAPPACTDPLNVRWQVCQEGFCRQATTTLMCE